MDKELVVSRYDEDVSWVLGLGLGDLCNLKATIYNKGEPLDIDHPDIDVIDLPNLGREAGSMLTHICDHYDDLALTTFFAQGSPHADHLRERVSLEYADTTGLTVEYLPDWPSPGVKAKDKVEHVGGHEVRYGLADPEVPGRCDACASDCQELWSRYFTGPMPSPWWFVYGSELAVPKARILARPRSYWIWCLEQVNRTDQSSHEGITTAWSFELLWMYLFGDAEKYPVRMLKKATPPARRKITVKEARKMGYTPAEINKMKGGCGCGGKK